MKKSKIFIMFLALAIALMGAGYASWSQSFKVSNSISTGELKVVVDQLGKYTKVTGVKIMDSSGVIISKHEMYNGDPVQLEDGRLSYEPKNGSDLEYFDIAMSTPADKESLTLDLLGAYPGIEVESIVKVKNIGTVPVIIDADDPIKFKGADSYAQLLLDDGFIEFVIEPMRLDNRTLESIDGNTTITWTMKINSSLPNDAQNKSLKFNLEFNANQGI